MRISDNDLRAWKSIVRGTAIRDHIWVEPGAVVRLILGSLAVEADEGITVFELSTRNRLSFRIVGDDILLTSLLVTTEAGREMVKVEDNHLRYEPGEGITFRRIPGRVDVFVPVTEDFIPDWVLRQVRFQDRFFGLGGRVKMLGLRVVRPGVARVEGIWAEGDHAVVITHNRLSLCRPGLREPVSMVGEGEESVLRWTGPITGRMFGFR